MKKETIYPNTGAPFEVVYEREGGPQAISAWKEYIEIELTVTSI